jgi:glutathione peroxidase
MFQFLTDLFKSKEHVPASIYDIKAEAIDGTLIDLAACKGKKILIVNTASYCGHTPQYEGLQQLHQQFDNKLEVIGFPCNNFLMQDPGSNNKIAEFCSTRFRITFPMGAKLSVKGPAKATIYRWLTEKKYNGFADSSVKWNFQKYLINEEGKLTHIFSPKTLPLSDEVIAAIKE